MKKIGLSGSKVTGQNIKCPSFTRGSSIEVLDLSKCKDLSNEGILSLLNISGGTIRGLNISFTNISLENIGSLTSSLTLLEELNLKRCSNLAEYGIVAFIEKISDSIKIFDCSTTKVSFSGIGSLTRFSVLEVLNLSRCDHLTDSGLIVFLNSAEKTLRVLDLSSTRVSLAGIESLPGRYPKMEKLNLAYCNNMTDLSTIALLNKTGESLRVLNLSNTRVSFSDIGSQTIRFLRLEVINLSSCDNLTESGIIALLNKTGKSLKILDLSLNEISLSDIGSLNSNLGLEELYLSNCHNLRDPSAIALLNKTGATLKILDLSLSEISFSE